MHCTKLLEIPTIDFEHEQNLGFCLREQEMEDSIVNITFDGELEQQESLHLIHLIWKVHIQKPEQMP